MLELTLKCDSCGYERLAKDGMMKPIFAKKETGTFIVQTCVDEVSCRGRVASAHLYGHCLNAMRTCKGTAKPDGSMDCECTCDPCKNMMYQSEKPFDPVGRPKHYTDRKIEVIDFIADCGWAEGFCLGNAVKYASRAGKKDPAAYVQDLEKGRWYLDWWVNAVKTQKLDVPSLLKGPPANEKEAPRG